MAEDKLTKQVEEFNRIFHEFWRAVMFDRQDAKSESIQKLSFLEMHFINLAYKHPDMILKEIREHIKVPQTTLSSIVGKLEKQGFIQRVINHRDMRSFSIVVTEKGKNLLQEHRRQDLEIAKQFVLSLDEDERDTFINLFKKVVSGVKKARQ